MAVKQTTPQCPVCGTEHFLKTSPRTDEPMLADCVKALRGEIEKLNGEAANAPGYSEAIGSLNARVAALEAKATEPLIERV